MNQQQLRVFLERRRYEHLQKGIDGKEAFVDLGCFARTVPDRIFQAEFHRSEKSVGLVDKIILRSLLDSREEFTLIPDFLIPMSFPAGSDRRYAEIILNGAGHVIVLEWY